MKQLLQLEELAQFAISIFILNLLPVSFSWWVWILLFLAPDFGMIGYLANSKVGAFTYNLFHHKLIAIAVFVIGFYLQMPFVETAGVILFGHASMDRIFGYGLKHSDAFKHTHLGWMK